MTPRIGRFPKRDVYLRIAEITSLRGTCPRAQVGAVLVMDGRLISTGYNGAPSHMAHCTDVGCQIENGHCIRAVHAEANAIAFAARKGIATEGATLFCTHEPCSTCAKLLINAGIVAVHYMTSYSHTHHGIALLSEAGIKVNLDYMED